MPQSIQTPQEIDEVILTERSMTPEPIPSGNEGENVSWKNVRDQISDSMKDPKNNLSEARRTIERASVSLRLENGKETADLIMENERMKTSMMILNQRLKEQTDVDEQIAQLKSKNKDLEQEIE